MGTSSVLPRHHYLGTVSDLSREKRQPKPHVSSGLWSPAWKFLGVPFKTIFAKDLYKCTVEISNTVSGLSGVCFVLSVSYLYKQPRVPLGQFCTVRQEIRLHTHATADKRKLLKFPLILFLLIRWLKTAFSWPCADLHKNCRDKQILSLDDYTSTQQQLHSGGNFIPLH